MLLPIAHAGHWAIYVLYAVPFIVVGFSILTTMLRQRREHQPAERERS
jgi:uncharacterized membrane protein HdeD (DUF308 family)